MTHDELVAKINELTLRRVQAEVRKAEAEAETAEQTRDYLKSQLKDNVGLYELKTFKAGGGS